MLSYDQIIRKIASWSGIDPIVYDMCLNSCLAFTGPFMHLEQCPMCSRERFDPVQLELSNGNVKVPVQQFYTLPVGPQIQALWCNPRTADYMQFHDLHTQHILDELSNNNGVIDVYDDLYHGSEYPPACLCGDIKSKDTVLICSMDGAQLYRDKDSDCWICIWINMNLKPDIRYKKVYVLPGCVVPGPNKPKNMDSFLFPGLHHVGAIQKEGLRIWNAADKWIYNSNIFFYIGMSF
jgi:hypothetical protein